MFEHPDNSQWLAVNADLLSEGNNLAPNFLGRAEEFIAQTRPDDAHAAGIFVVDFVEHAAILDNVLVHVQSAWPGADKVIRRKRLPPVRESGARQAHLRSNQGNE